MALRLLLLVNLLLGLASAHLWVDSTGQWRHMGWVAPQPLLPELPAAVQSEAPRAPNPGLHLAILDRPIFAPDRLPPPPPEVQAPPPPPPPPDPLDSLQPFGLFHGAEGAGMLASVDGRVRRLRLSDTVGSWTLKAVEGRDITFSRGEETRVIRLVHAKWGAPPKAVPPKAPPGAAPPPVANQVHDVQTEEQRRQEYVRENIRKRNEIRIKAGLPPVND